MKKIIFLTLASIIVFSCGTKDKGELTGVTGKAWHPEKPYGMSLIPGGAFVMGKSDDDIVDLKDAPTRTVTVRSFYMDETEITNSEYRQFVEWVRDSILRQTLAEMAELEGKSEEDEGIGQYAYADSGEEEDLTPYERYMLDTYGDDQRKINSDIDLVFDTEDYPDELYAEVMDGMYLPPDEWYNGQRTWDVSQFEFEYTNMDIENAAENSASISSGEVKKVAQLARLELNESESHQHAEQLEKILEYIKQLEKINTENVPCTTRAIEVVNVLRKDEKKNYENSEEILDLAPSRENKFFKVPKIINE